MKKKTAGGTYRGYEAIRTTMGTWTDYTGRKRPMEIWRTEIRTPYSLGIGVEDLNKRLRKDLESIFVGISIYDKKTCNQRAYDDISKPYLIGCTATKDWQLDRWTVTLITRADFNGFPET